MRAVRWVILILLVSLLGDTVLLDPLSRFGTALYEERFDRAEAIYLAHLKSDAPRDREARELLRRFAEQQLEGYYGAESSYDQVMAVLTPLFTAELPQDDVARCVQAIQAMEAARTALAEADACFAQGDYRHAIPLYRRSLIAEGTAADRLEQAETEWKDHLLAIVDIAMTTGQYDDADAALSEALTVLENDADLADALADLRRMQVDQVYAERLAEARHHLQADGPEAAIGYMTKLRQQSPDEYALVYMEQIILHACEEDICVRAAALQDEGDPKGACDLLKEGLELIDSNRMKDLHAQIMDANPVWLVDMPLSRDDTASLRTGADSTVALDQVLTDSLSNEYAHSIFADTGSITFTLQGTYRKLVGTIAFPAGETSDVYRTSATLQIFGDGMLISEFKHIDSTCAPLPFSLPIEGVNELTLAWTSEGANGWKDWGRFATLFDGRLLYSSQAQGN